MGRQSWAEPLFPPARRSSLPWPLLVCGYTGGFVLVVVLALARQSGLPATGTLWAEDGVIFYSQAVAHSVLHTLVASYNGYGQLVPRLAVQLTGLGPLRDVPTTVALSGAVGLALVSCLVFHMARGLITSPALRALLVASMVLLPLAVVEMLDNLVNLPWWIFFAAFWALLWRPSGPGGRAVAAVVCLLAAASEPLVGLLMPLALVRAVALPRWRENAASVGLAFGLVYQLAVVLGAHGERSFSRTGVTSIPAALGARVGLGWLTGLRATDAIVRWDRPVAEVVGGVIFLAILVAGLKLGDRRVPGPDRDGGCAGPPVFRRARLAPGCRALHANGQVRRLCRPVRGHADAHAHQPGLGPGRPPVGRARPHRARRPTRAWRPRARRGPAQQRGDNKRRRLVLRAVGPGLGGRFP